MTVSGVSEKEEWDVALNLDYFAEQEETGQNKGENLTEKIFNQPVNLPLSKNHLLKRVNIQSNLQAKILSVWEMHRGDNSSHQDPTPLPLHTIAMSRPSISGRGKIKAKDGEVEGEVGITYEDEFLNESGQLIIDGHIDSKGDGEIEFRVKKDFYEK